MIRLNKGKVLKTKTPCPVYEEYLHLLTSNPGIRHAYQTLLSSFYIQESARPLKTFLVTSTQPEEGKTTVSVNLALIAMLTGKKVLLVDADLRRPRVHEIFRMDNKIGLGDLLTGTVDIHDSIQVVPIAHEGSRDAQTVSVITSGTASLTSTMLAMCSPKLKEVLAHVADRFDLVFLDSPPVLSVTDPLLLAPIVDGIVMVVATGCVTEMDAKRAKERLEQAGGHVLGVALNRYDERLYGPGFHPYSTYLDGAEQRHGS